MKLPVRAFLPVACLAAIVGAGVIAQAQPAGGGGGQPAGQPDGGRRGGPGGPGGQGGQGGRAPSVEGAMKALNRAIHEVADTIGDAAKKDDTLNGIYAAEAAAASSKRGKLEGDAAKRVDEFRRDGHKLLGMLVDLEGMVLDGKTDAAKAKLKEIEEFRDASHKKFGVKDEGKEGGGGGGGGAPRGQRPPTGG